MEKEYQFCLEHFHSKVSKMTRIEMMKALCLGPQEFQEIILEGGFNGAVHRAFRSLWQSMDQEEQMDFYHSINKEEEE